MPTKKLTSSVFISHSSKDNEFVHRLAAELEKHSIKFWLDAHELDIGDSLFDTIAPAIDEADYLAVVLSGASINSLWVKRELNAAMTREDEEDRKIILPLLLEDVRIPLFIKHKVFADFTSEEKFDESFKKILKVLGFHEKDSPDHTTPDNLAAKLYPDFFLPDLRFFVGRETLLDQIKTTLNKDHRAVIHDISGLGKTFTSYKFVHDHHGDYEKIFLVRATKEEMLESLAKCGELVDPQLAEVTEQRVKALGFKQWLEENNKWLVIYDNVDLPNELFPFVPVNKNGECVFTSNFREVTNLGTEISIRKLDKADAEILLYSRAYNRPQTTPDLTTAEQEAFDALISEIDGLPLTLNSTGALINKKPQWNFARFWEKYQKTPEIAWESEDDYSVYQRKSAGIVFSVAYDELREAEKVGDAVKTVLNSVSFLAPDEIPEELLRKILRTQDDSFRQMKQPDDFWDEVLEKLTAYDLLKYDGQKETFTTHRAIQRVIQYRLKNKNIEICSSLLEIFLEVFPVYKYSNKENCVKYYQHVLTLLENSDKFKIETAIARALYFRTGQFQHRLGNYAQAEKSHRRAAEISVAVAGEESQAHSQALNELALMYKLQGMYDQAIETYEEALRIAEKATGKEHPEFSTYLNNLANVYLSQGRYKEAIEKFEEVLRFDEKTVGKEHSDYAIDLSNLGYAYHAVGKYDEAIENFQEALRIGEKTIGKDHTYYAGRLNNLASVYFSQGKYDQAVETFDEALRIQEKVVGKDHPDYAIGLNNVATIYEAQNNYRDALDSYEKALVIFNRTVPDSHPFIGKLITDIERCRKALKIS